jgi:hypothetical protein
MKPGERLGDRYELEQAIGSGGMGEIFRARDRVTGEAVAAKVLADDRGLRTERFAREIQLLAELSHPGIVRYISHGVASSGERFLIMEWLDGEDLRARLRRGSLAVGEAVTLATRVAEALGVAHARGIVHRDLKPSNLLLSGGRIDRVKVLDFGIARREGRTQLTQTGVLIGTPGYTAPELARAGGRVDARADVFALGCVLFECLTGVPPFQADTTAAVLAKILFGAAPRVSELWPDVPEALDALTAQMLAKEPAQRPSDGANLAAALAVLGPIAHSAVSAPKERVVGARVFIAGERRTFAVVMLASADPDDQPSEDVLGRVVQPYGGHLEQLADGATVIVFDAEGLVATDRAAQAARCALGLHALSNGRAMAIAMGWADPTSQLSRGEVIERAPRLLPPQLRGPDDLPPIMLDEVIAGLLDARFDVIELAGGLALCGERTLAQGARTLLGRPTSCVGRDWELGFLTGILDECVDEEEARGVLVIGAAGLGKSRLASEFVSRVAERHAGIAIWVGRGDSMHAGATLDLLAQALRGALGIVEEEAPADRRDKLRARVAEHVPAGNQRRVTEFLGRARGRAAARRGRDQRAAASRAPGRPAHERADALGVAGLPPGRDLRAPGPARARGPALERLRHRAVRRRRAARTEQAAVDDDRAGAPRRVRRVPQAVGRPPQRPGAPPEGAGQEGRRTPGPPGARRRRRE